MNFSIKSFKNKNDIKNQKTSCIVVGVYEDGKLSSEVRSFSTIKLVNVAIKSGDITGKPGSCLLIHISDSPIQRVLIVGLGSSTKITNRNFLKVIEATAKVFSTLGSDNGIFTIPTNFIKNLSLNKCIETAIKIFRESNYSSEELKSKKEKSNKGIKKISFVVPQDQTLIAKKAISRGNAISNGIDLAKNLGNLPPNICTPSYLAQAARMLSKKFDLKVEVLNRKQIETLKMGSFLSVTNGTPEPPKFIILKHLNGKPKDSPIVLVGKGITFDTGGISLKSGNAMDEMKYDMCGASSVIGTMSAVAEMKLKLNVIGVVPSCENMPSGTATRPGDIVTSMSGQTIEILNTDAEGRLILCDALTFVEKYNPECVIDIATLTGACITALGHHNTGLFTRHDKLHDNLANELINAGKETNDTAWRLPIEGKYQDQLKSNFADIPNIGGGGAGSITAACFLERFTKNYTWVHLDIAGTAWKSGGAKGATGRPVPMLTNFLISREKKYSV